MPIAVAPLSENALSVRRDDRDRFVTALFAPPDRREDLFALYAFNLEIARIRELVSEPLLGQIRLQWWRDNLDKLFAGIPIAHPVAAGLGQAVTRHGLSRTSLERLLDAREKDMDNAAFADFAALEAYVADTAGELASLAMAILGPVTAEADQVARQVGKAWGLTGLLRAVPFHAASRRLYLPLDLLAIQGLTDEDIYAGRESPELQTLAQHLAARAAQSLTEARRGRRHIPRPAIAAVLPARLTSGYLRALRKTGYRLTDKTWSATSSRPLALLASAATGRY